MKFQSVSSIVISAIAIMGFSQCKQQPEAVSHSEQPATIAVSGIKIAFVNVDSLLANYALYQDLAEEITRKEENYRLLLSEEGKKLQKEIDDFQKKLENGVYSSRERAESEQNRLAKKQQALQEKTVKYSQELENESATNSQKISETIDTFIKEYNKTHGYDLIISKGSLLFAQEAMNITADILKGLNAEYISPEK